MTIEMAMPFRFPLYKYDILSLGFLIDFVDILHGKNLEDNHVLQLYKYHQKIIFDCGCLSSMM